MKVTEVNHFCVFLISLLVQASAYQLILKIYRFQEYLHIAEVQFYSKNVKIRNSSFIFSSKLNDGNAASLANDGNYYTNYNSNYGGDHTLTIHTYKFHQSVR